jgi:hypothetical protein
MRWVLIASTFALSALATAACYQDTYCQSGPRYGTSCYSGMTVRERDPLAPVAPMPPVTHGVASWVRGVNVTVDAGTPQMFRTHVADAGSDASDDASD